MNTEPSNATPNAALYAALARARAQFEPLHRSKTVKVTPKQRKDGSQPPPYTFAYAELADVYAVAVKALSAEGLAVYHRLNGEGGVVAVETLLTHAEGGALSSGVLSARAEDIQGMGSMATYLRRYQLAALLGIASEEDDDGNASLGNSVQAKPSPRDKKPSPEPQEPASGPLVAYVDGEPTPAFKKAWEVVKGVHEHFASQDKGPVPPISAEGWAKIEADAQENGWKVEDVAATIAEYINGPVHAKAGGRVLKLFQSFRPKEV